MRQRLQQLQQLQADRRLFHHAKQLQAAVKKAKALLLRKTVRKLHDVAQGPAAEAAALRLALIKALPPAAVAREALGSRGVSVPAPTRRGTAARSDAAGAAEGEWERLRAEHPQASAAAVGALLGSQAVREQLDAAAALARSADQGAASHSVEGEPHEPAPAHAPRRKRARPEEGGAGERAGDGAAAEAGAARHRQPKAASRKAPRGASSVFVASLAAASDDEGSDEGERARPCLLRPSKAHSEAGCAP